MKNRWSTRAALLFALTSVSSFANSAKAQNLNDVQSLGFIGPCDNASKKDAYDFEEVEDLIRGPEKSWYLLNFQCESDSNVDGVRGLWFKGSDEKKFRKIAEYDRNLFVQANHRKDWLLFVCGPGSGEANAFLLPVRAFTSTRRIPRPNLNGSNVAFDGIDPAGYIDLLRVCRTFIPKQFNGRTEMEVTWLNDSEIGIYVWARNPDENASWTGTAIYSLKTSSIKKSRALPVNGFSWFGEIAVPDKGYMGLGD